MSHFFIERPIFAWVIAIIIMLAGVLSIVRLPISQYPEIAPPSVVVSATYPGASAQTIQDTVTQVIEQKMTGLDHLIYMASTSDSTGNMELTLTFSAEANPDIAQVQVQNKLQLAMPLLPDEVQRQGITVKKSNSTIMKVYGFISEDGSKEVGDIGDYVGSQLLDGISRLPGVGEATLYGSIYGMRIWLNPHKLRSYSLTPSDAITAIQSQNAQISAGQLGGAPAVQGQKINLSIALQERLQTPEQFGAIILRTNPDGSMVRVRDVARVELGSESYNIFGRFMRKPAANIAIKLATGANALQTAKNIDAYLAEQSAYFPSWLKLVYPYDTTPFVEISIHEVVKTLVEAIALVVLIMYLFLQNIRATLIPTLAVPVVLLGTFGVLSALGYSINTLTMFAMVLAIGLLVDDAIVVVENVERIMYVDGLPPKEATKKSMSQITSALVGIAVVLSAVFVPMSFMEGSVGVIYRQFSVTIVSAMVLSVVVALIFTPALCATLLKKPPKGAHLTQHGFLGAFNKWFDRTLQRYQKGVAMCLRRSGRCMFIYAVFIVGLLVLVRALPTGFLPDEDQGVAMMMAQLPPGATLEDTTTVVKEIENYLINDEKDTVMNCMAVVGFNFAGRGQNGAMIFARLHDWSKRKSHSQKVDALVDRARRRFAGLPNAQVYVFAPPAIQELGNASGFDLQLQDVGGVGHEALLAGRNQLLGMAAQNSALMAVRPNGMEDQPQLRVHVDREKAGALGLNLADVNATLSTIWGSAYADDFLDRGRVKKVYVQGLAEHRMTPEDMNKWYFRNGRGEMVPFSAFATCQWEYAPTSLNRYNGLPSLEILGSPAPGKSTGQAMVEMEKMMDQLPAGMGHSWTGISFQERQSGAQAPLLYALSLLVVFLCLAALYESWSVPFSVMLVVPLGALGSLLWVFCRGFNNDVYFQVGLLAVIGLSAKNAILIVEFAKEMHDSGTNLAKAAISAARLRLRPILMTSLAFLLGILPLTVSSGAGSGGQNALGTGVMGGTLLATLLGVFFIPLFFVIVTAIFASKGVRQ
ncbi:efflux RND transporter permease subunit [Desulfovibrio desulfuricans]|uniref:Efflux RND transporter permease subunit n=1 Tax=Desulfovibrio desulfuricans TaxID=876 RepID=A0A4P7ULT2_DESDE|nr:efflux RND transporter permease subunit [Desulfovibrio desulfuricans]QCC85874.1 efflux RND transporter permease subunit [Desulfovibrio desulfuricans]